jgi:hypothetical protein
MRACDSESSAAEAMSTPMRRTRSGCCARAARGQATAAPPPRNVMNSRRFISSWPPTHVAARQHRHANRRSFSQQRHAEHDVVFADFFWCSIIWYSRNEPISAIRSSC